MDKELIKNIALSVLTTKEIIKGLIPDTFESVISLCIYDNFIAVTASVYSGEIIKNKQVFMISEHIHNEAELEDWTHRVIKELNDINWEDEQ